MRAHVILHTSCTSVLLLELSLGMSLNLLGVAQVLHLELVLMLQLLANELVLLLSLELHLDWDLSLEARCNLLHLCWFLLLDELEERPQPVLVLEQVLNRILVFCNER